MDLANESVKYHVREQKQWLEGLGAGELKNWLREAIWRNDYFPLSIPDVSQLSFLLAETSPQLTVKVREILPSLLKEWGANDPARCLDALLILCGVSRSADAETVIMQIATERLERGDYNEETRLRQRCLSVLSGFGCSEATAHIFKQYITQNEYAALCYRALYRYRRIYAVSELPLLADVYRQNDRLLQLKSVLEFLLFDYFTQPAERIDFWTQVLCHTNDDDSESLLDTLAKIGIIFAPVMEEMYIEKMSVTYIDILEEWMDATSDIIESSEIQERNPGILFTLISWQEKYSINHLPEIAAAAAG